MNSEGEGGQQERSEKSGEFSTTGSAEHASGLRRTSPCAHTHIRSPCEEPTCYIQEQPPTADYGWLTSTGVRRRSGPDRPPPCQSCGAIYPRQERLLALRVARQCRGDGENGLADEKVAIRRANYPRGVDDVQSIGGDKDDGRDGFRLRYDVMQEM